MADDPYTVLGLTTGATKSDVGRAFRRLAKKHHPDTNPNDPAAEERFKAITAAHDYLMGKGDDGLPDVPPRYDHAYAAELESRIRARRGPARRGFGARLGIFFRSLFGRH
jgi:curved DNA-binding protein CbpA